MKVNQITVSATIPTGQYANLIPSVTVDVETLAEVEKAKALALSHIVQISQTYAEEGKALQGGSPTVSGTFKKVDCLVGGSILYDEKNHIYTNEAGDKYLGGSTYAKQFEKPFEIDAITAKMEAKSGIPAQTIKDIWKLKGQASASFGSSIHQALEMYGKYAEACKTLEKDYHQSAIPMVNDIVSSFFAGRETEKALYEPMVVDHDRKWAGQIDRLLVTGDKKCIIEDYKTNPDLTPAKKETYAHQLSFYAAILTKGGWSVEGIRLHHWNGKWATVELPIKEVKE